MFATFAPRTDTHKIKGVPVKVTEILSDTARVTLPNGRAANLAVKDLVSFSGDITFANETAAALVCDEPTAPEAEDAAAVEGE